MGSSSSFRLFGRQRTVHQILGGGFIADVALWRRSDVSLKILVGTLAAWALFRLSGHTLVSLLSNVLLLLFSTLFLWAKCAHLLMRPPPPIPELYVTPEASNEAAMFLHSKLNSVLSASHDIALGKNSKLFYRVAVCLMSVSFVGSCLDFPTFAYSSLVVLLSFPVMYEKFEDNVDRLVVKGLIRLYMYERIYAECFRKAKEWITETLKES